MKETTDNDDPGSFADLRGKATADTRLAAVAYDELDKRTTIAWHAAHHRFVLATAAARDSLAALVEAAGEVHAAGAAAMVPDLDVLRAELDEFVEVSRARFAITAATLTGAVPAGFEQPAGRFASDGVGAFGSHWPGS